MRVISSSSSEPNGRYVIDNNNVTISSEKYNGANAVAYGPQPVDSGAANSLFIIDEIYFINTSFDTNDNLENENPIFIDYACSTPTCTP
jgi:hypothetical protein